MTADAWLSAIQLCLQPSVILFLTIGIVIGTAIGALPGLSATMGIAILTPITFWFEPADGFAMLMGLWNAAIFAGGISANSSTAWKALFGFVLVIEQKRPPHNRQNRRLRGGGRSLWL